MGASKGTLGFPPHANEPPSLRDSGCPDRLACHLLQRFVYPHTTSPMNVPCPDLLDGFSAVDLGGEGAYRCFGNIMGVALIGCHRPRAQWHAGAHRIAAIEVGQPRTPEWTGVLADTKESVSESFFFGNCLS